MSPLFPALTGGAPAGRPALCFGERSLTYAELAAAAGALAARIRDAGRVAVWATPTLETAVGVVAALLAGVPAVPLNPKSGGSELGHIVKDSAPTLVLTEPGTEMPSPLDELERLDIDVRGQGGPYVFEDVSPASPALVVYTSGTTGPPKGAVIPRRAIAATLDALADAWQWTEDDVLVHALPLFHVHGLILGVLGPLRRGGSVRHLGRFDTEGVARELSAGATMLFGVPTMYHRIAEALPGDPGLAKALGRARLLVSGSAALPVHDHERIAAATGRRVIERYGMTETLMNTSVRADGEPRAGTVGVPLPGVELRLVEDDGSPQTAYDGESVGEIQVRGPNLFTEYLNRPDATAAAFTPDGWFRTGDMAVRDPDGYVRIVGRKATDLIKSGGYKIGAGEIENALLEHPGVREAAVTGEPDADLGERVVAWIVAADPRTPPTADALSSHVADRLAPHKRPRTVRFIDALPRNDMGKIMKRALKPVTELPSKQPKRPSDQPKQPGEQPAEQPAERRFSAREAIALVTDDFTRLPAPDQEHPADGPLAWQGYDASRTRAAERTGEEESVVCGRAVVGSTTVVLIAFEFGFLGGSLGEHTGDRLESAYGYAREHRLPVVSLVATGGSRMQEGMRALTQLQRVARQSALTREAGLPRIAVLRDPTTGGGWATLGAGADVILALPGAQVGFAGSRVRPSDADPTAYTAESQLAAGAADAVVPPEDLRNSLALWLELLTNPSTAPAPPPGALSSSPTLPTTGWEAVERARSPRRPRADAYLDAYFARRTAISGDRCGGTDPGMLCGFGEHEGRTVAYAAQRGTATRPAGYRTATRLIRLAGQLGIPVLTLVDTPGAANDADAERQGAGAAIADLFTAVATARTPVTTLLIGEGGSGGALALAAPDNTWATPDSYFSVIAPELAAAILKRPAEQVRGTADELRVRPQDLVRLGVVRGITAPWTGA